jgi:hypothetical protein
MDTWQGWIHRCQGVIMGSATRSWLSTERRARAIESAETAVTALGRRARRSVQPLMSATWDSQYWWTWAHRIVWVAGRNGIYVQSSQLLSQSVWWPLSVVAGSGYFAHHYKRWSAGQSTSTFPEGSSRIISPKCWATASWDVMSSQQLANLLHLKHCLPIPERDNLNQGTTVYKWEADLEAL